MNNKEILHFIMTNIVINAPKPCNNTFELALPQELFAELYEEFQILRKKMDYIICQEINGELTNDTRIL